MMLAGFPNTNLLRRVYSRERGRLGEAVSFEDLDVDVLEEVEHFHRRGRPSHKGRLQLATEPVANLAQDHLNCDGEPEGRTYFVVFGEGHYEDQWCCVAIAALLRVYNAVLALRGRGNRYNSSKRTHRHAKSSSAYKTK